MKFPLRTLCPPTKRRVRRSQSFHNINPRPRGPFPSVVDTSQVYRCPRACATGGWTPGQGPCFTGHQIVISKDAYPRLTFGNAGSLSAADRNYLDTEVCGQTPPPTVSHGGRSPSVPDALPRMPLTSSLLSPQQCSGHGGCSDAEPQSCTCDVGYFGPLCEHACPGSTDDVLADNGAEVVCHGHGTCDDGAGRNGTCSCDLGYAGADCFQSCPMVNGLPCNGHGECDNAPDGSSVCRCDSGWARFDCSATCEPEIAIKPCKSCDAGFAGDQCEHCAAGYYGRLPTVGADDLSPTRGSDVVCEACPAMLDGLPCNGHGVCLGEGVGCVLNRAPYAPSGLPAAAIAQPTAGPRERTSGRETPPTVPSCDPRVQRTRTLTLTRNPNSSRSYDSRTYDRDGTLLSGVTFGTGDCQCDFGYGSQPLWDYCKAQCPGGNSRPCSGHGRCVYQSQPPWTANSPDVQCVCDDLWVGDACERRDPKLSCGASNDTSCYLNPRLAFPANYLEPSSRWHFKLTVSSCERGAYLALCSNEHAARPTLRHLLLRSQPSFSQTRVHGPCERTSPRRSFGSPTFRSSTWPSYKLCPTASGFTQRSIRCAECFCAAVLETSVCPRKPRTS